MQKFATQHYKEEFKESFADSDRYVTDRYDIRVYLLETKDGYSVSCVVNASQVGLASFVQYWHYKPDELSAAKKTMREVKKVATQYRQQIEYDRSPMPIIISSFKAVMDQLDIAHQETSGVPSFNFSKLQPLEPDWRNSLYGKRYPSSSSRTILFEQNPETKNIQVSSNNTRNRVYSYKYASISTPNDSSKWQHQFVPDKVESSLSENGVEKEAAKTEPDNLIQSISTQWKINPSIARSFLIWFLAIGGTPEFLHNSLLQGLSPQQVMAAQDTQNPPLPHDNKTNTTLAVAPTSLPAIDTINLDGLQPEFRTKVENILRKLQNKGWKPKVAEGLRTLEQQKEKVKKGYSKTLKSKHLDGLAADIIDKRYGWGKEAADTNFQFWTDLGQCAKEEGLIWGGNFKNFKDVAHVEFQPKQAVIPPITPNTKQQGQSPTKQQ